VEETNETNARHVSRTCCSGRTYALFNMWHTLKTAHEPGYADIKPHGIVAPPAEIAFAPHAEFRTFWDVHYPVAISLKRQHVSAR